MDASKHRGITFIELLITLSVILLGVLAVAKMEIQSFSSNRFIELRSLAVSQVNSLAERILAATSDGEKSQKIRQWQAQIAKALPLGLATIEPQGDDYAIEVSWYETHINGHSECELEQQPQRQCIHLTLKG